MRILIDADGCPVVDSTIAIAKKHQIECLILCDSSHHFDKDGAHTLTFSKGADAVDFALANMLQPFDIAITQDYGLAAMCLAKRAVPINQNGFVYDDSNINALLLQRHTAKKIRRSGGRSSPIPKRTDKQNEDFIKTLESVITALSAK